MGEKKRPLSRRDFLKLVPAGLVSGWLLLNGAGCSSPDSTSKLQSPEIQPGSNPDLAFLTAITGMNLNNPNKLINEANKSALHDLIKNPDQLDIFLASLAQNWRRTNRMTQLQDAIRQGYAFGWSDCSDSRIKVPDAIPSYTLSDMTPAAVHGASVATTFDPLTGETTNYMTAVEGLGNGQTQDWSLELKPAINPVLEVRQIGTQPSVYPPGIKQSVFFTHESIPQCGNGCGFLGGVETLFTDGGAEALRHHGVPEETIGYIIEWKSKYGKAFDVSGDKITPDIWAEIGARIQAYINYKVKSETHTVLYGVRAHGTEEIIIKNVIRYDGFEFVNVPLTEVPVLEGAVNFINHPHPAIEAVVKGQQPAFNILSISSKSPSFLYGEQAQGTIFVVNHDANPVTAQSLEDLVKGFGYSPGTLTQQGKIIELVADSEGAMTQLRQAFLGTTYADEWFKNGGLLVELIPDEVTGLFKKTIRLRNMQYPDGAILAVSDQEQALLAAGAKKITGAIRIIEKPAGETILVRVSDLKGNIYDLNIPKGSAYSAITAETLEKAGLPVAEALWWEKSLTVFTKVFGTAATIAGIVWMAYDGVKLYIDLMGLGETVQINRTSKLPPIPNVDILQSIGIMGLENTAAYGVYEGSDIKGTEERFTRRIGAINTKSIGAPKQLPYFIRIDGSQVGVPFLAPDEDLSTPIMVNCDHQEQPDGQTNVFKITYTNVVTNESMVFEKQPDGSFLKISGPDEFTFTTIITPPSFPKDHFAIPLAFRLDPETNRETIFSNYTG